MRRKFSATPGSPKSDREVPRCGSEVHLQFDAALDINRTHGSRVETQEQVTCLFHIKSTRVIFMMLLYIYTIYKPCAVIFIENKLTKTTRCVKQRCPVTLVTCDNHYLICVAAFTCIGSDNPE